MEREKTSFELQVISPEITEETVAAIEESKIFNDSEKGWVWLVVLGSFVVHFVVFGLEFTFGVFQQYYEQTKFTQHSSKEIALVGTIESTTCYVFGVFSGPLAERLGFRQSILIGSVILASSLIGASFASQLWQLYLTQGFLLGVGASMVYFPAISAPSHWFVRKRSTAVSLAVSGAGVGGLVFAPGIDALFRLVGFNWTLRILGVLCLFAVGVTAFVLVPQRRSSVSLEKADENPKAKITRGLWKDLDFISLLGMNFLSSLGHLVPFFFISSYAVSQGFTPAKGALLIGLLNGASCAGRLVFIFVTERVGRVNQLLICAFCMGASILTMWFKATAYGVLVGFCLVFGISFGGYFSMLPVVVADIYGTSKLASYLGILYSVLGVGYMIGNPVAGALLDMSSGRDYTTAIIYCGVSTLLATGFLIWFKHRRSNGKFLKRM
ncbi:MFS general substrate transporter [Basidiobolus meristosporus CBS 931.73]|uniref:MFS general substrate transporter n=1 Tax=Basidiobolus meristosporus CBS 931.73 TaxID=1314790 RepID=A0A1Y1YML4_9FUNG|nr:MFS general substrate transporter [Basidiobolus meristosporus CBS 931.73]|eukprot:ORX99257.1 MFS general substrate transporter [Basidiobolus meristosporus CBS 931.73]